jgi:hypothetical protein
MLGILTIACVKSQACMRGSVYVNDMVLVFEEYQKHSAAFPLLFRQRRTPEAEDDWDVEMFVCAFPSCLLLCKEFI